MPGEIEIFMTILQTFNSASVSAGIKILENACLLLDIAFKTEMGPQVLRIRTCCLQVIQEGGDRPDGLPHLAFYLDGAHTQESMSACGHWFADSLLAEQASSHQSSKL